jgi:hypothetical protein
MSEENELTQHFFTRDIYLRAYRNDDWQRVYSAREQCLMKIKSISDFPQGLLTIADPFYVDDALISKLCQTESPCKLELTLRCGNLQTGYFNLSLKYYEPVISDQSLRVLLSVAAATKDHRRFDARDLWCHELTKLPTGLVGHRLIFHGPSVGDIAAKTVTAKTEPRDSRRLAPYKSRYFVERLKASSASG